MATAGFKSKVKVKTSAAGALSNVLGLKSASHDVSGSSQDISSFDSDWTQRILGLLDGTMSFGGTFKAGDTNGQLALRNAMLTRASVWIQVLHDGVSGFEQEVVITKFAISTAADGTAEVSIDAEGTGAVVAV